MLKAGGDGLELHSAGYRHRIGSIGGGAVAELAAAVVSPAVRTAIGREGACVTTAHGKLGEREVGRDRLRRQLLRRCGRESTPAVRLSRGGERAGEGLARTNALEGESAAHHRRRETVRRRAVAKLAAAVGA